MRRVGSESRLDGKLLLLNTQIVVPQKNEERCLLVLCNRAFEQSVQFAVKAWSLVEAANHLENGLVCFQ